MRQIKADTEAAEYVLGTLDPEARRHFAEQISGDPSLQELVDAWEQRLGALEHGVTPVDPPAGLWIEQLQNNYRKSILLAYYYGLTHEELAARLETPLGTVKSWVRRGLHQLKGCVEQ